MKLKHLYAHWAALGNIPTVTNEDRLERIEKPFLHFSAGTDREVIWLWMERQNPKFVVGELMEGINRRPFRLKTGAFLVNNRICFEVAVAEELFDDLHLDIEEATNDRFEQFLTQSEGLFGRIDRRRYDALVESFIEIVVKSCCSVQ